MARTDETISKQSTCFPRPEGEAQEKSIIKKEKEKKKKGSLGTLHGPDLGLCMSSLYTRESGLSFSGSCQMQQ